MKGILKDAAVGLAFGFALVIVLVLISAAQECASKGGVEVMGLAGPVCVARFQKPEP